MTTRAAVWPVLLLASGAIGRAQQKFAAVDFVATDAHGEAVSGLRAADLSVLDSRHAEPVVYLHANDRETRTRHAALVVFDLRSGAIRSVPWNQTIAAMRQFEASDYVFFYVVTAGGVLLPVHPVPKEGLDSKAESSPWIDRNVPELERAAQSYRAAHGSEVVDFSQYAELAARLAAFPGRKSLVCIGCLRAGGSSVANDALALQAGSAFRDARVAVYVVDGLARPLYPASLVGESYDTVAASSIDGLSELTGGRVYTHGEIGEAISRAVQDNGASYRLAYLPAAANWDGRRHALKVLSARKDVRIAAPSWYMAERAEEGRSERRPPIPDWLIASPFDQHDISIAVSPPQKLAKGVRVTATVNAADLLLLAQGSGHTGRIVLQALCDSADGRKQACTEPLQVDLNLSGQEYATAMEGGLKFPFDLQEDRRPSKVRLLVHDAWSGLSGSVTVQLGEAR